ncbi:hypothetical protein MNBD_NITROSPINAE01-990 [hydrothermal vent metagenome]|uniref:Uncharacterized protein n=1 Tax=hydrothermal vent metagenome TaxID=652676 RepID=A0A3B1C9G2_9ZZZZ
MDKRIKALLVVMAGLCVVVGAIYLIPYENRVEISSAPAVVEKPHPADRQSALKTHLESHSGKATKKEVDVRFKQAVVMLHAKKYQHAITALDRVLQLEPEMPEAYVNLGFAFLGLEMDEQALGAFTKATDLRPRQMNAYYGMALAYGKLGNIRAAAGAMSTYAHLAKPDDPYKAKAANLLKEWESILDKEARVAPDTDSSTAKDIPAETPAL